MLIVFPKIQLVKTKQSGFSLVELMVAIAVMSILLAIALPSFRSMIQNSKVRNAAESVANGLQKARAEAVARNTNVTFVLGADAAGTYTSWTVNVVSTATVIESRNGNEGSDSVTRSVSPANATTVTFNSFGGVIANADASAQLAAVKLSAVNGSKDLGITIGAGGNTKMCDTTLSLSDSNPRACPVGWPL
jgi:type IV fimbrial biogenesis protein FimT